MILYNSFTDLNYISMLFTIISQACVESSLCARPFSLWSLASLQLVLRPEHLLIFRPLHIGFHFQGIRWLIPTNYHSSFSLSFDYRLCEDKDHAFLLHCIPNVRSHYLHRESVEQISAEPRSPPQHHSSGLGSPPFLPLTP